MCAVSFLLFVLQNGKGKGGSPAMFGERKEIAMKKVENRSLMERGILWAKLRRGNWPVQMKWREKCLNTKRRIQLGTGDRRFRRSREEGK